MAAEEVDNLLEGPPSGDFDIPPAIACARCGLATCEGCEPEPEDFAPASRQFAVLPWEREELTRHEAMLATSELAALNPQVTFGALDRGSLWRPLGFALLAETWGVISFSVVWAGLFYALFPHIAREMATSPTVLLIATGFHIALIAFVVFVHVLWGVGLEWGVKRPGGQANMNLGVRFGLYSCGWDLLTSPAGILFQIRRSGFKQGLRNIRASTKAPRPSMNAYLDDCRKLTPNERTSATWTAVWLGLFGVGAAGILLFATLLIAWLPWVF